jgi:hypothetical protein
MVDEPSRHHETTTSENRNRHAIRRCGGELETGPDPVCNDRPTMITPCTGSGFRRPRKHVALQRYRHAGRPSFARSTRGKSAREACPRPLCPESRAFSPVGAMRLR